MQCPSVGDREEEVVSDYMVSTHISLNNTIGFASKILNTQLGRPAPDDLWTSILNNYDVSRRLFKPVRVAQVSDGMSNFFMLFESAGRPTVYTRSHIVPDITNSNGKYWANNENCFTLHGNYTADNGTSNHSCEEQLINCSNAEEIYSFHVGGANFTYGDGSVHLVSETINIITFAALHSRSGGEIVNGEDF